MIHVHVIVVKNINIVVLRNNGGVVNYLTTNELTARPIKPMKIKQIKPKYNLPVNYNELHHNERRSVREQYVVEQEGLCYYCKCPLNKEASLHIREMDIDWSLFPPNFLQHPIHLQHNHNTGMTEGAVHNYCNAVMWQYEGR